MCIVTVLQTYKCQSETTVIITQRNLLNPH